MGTMETKKKNKGISAETKEVIEVIGMLSQQAGLTSRINHGKEV